MVAVPIEIAAEQGTGTHRYVGARIWLGSLIVLVFVMVLVGGATRLTESGLSITEWQPIAGAVPPLGEAAWSEAFELYRQSPQYDLLNRGMSLQDFKTIFWWEWAHRQLGRFIGLVFLGGFIWVVAKRAVPPRVTIGLIGLGALLAAQGLVGWIMVASGLQPGMTAVAPVRLAVHLTLACLFFACLLVLFVRLGSPREPASSARVAGAWGLVLLAFAQIGLGGLVAGHDAGLTYNTWPLMDGRFVPLGLGLLEPAWLNLVDNVTTIQFNHRIGAYVLLAAVLVYAVLASRRGSRAEQTRALIMFGLTLAQAALGIGTLILVVPLGLALAHQGLAMLLLFALVWNASVLRAGYPLTDKRSLTVAAG